MIDTSLKDNVGDKLTIHWRIIGKDIPLYRRVEILSLRSSALDIDTMILLRRERKWSRSSRN